MIGQDAGRGALPRDRRRASKQGEQGAGRTGRFAWKCTDFPGVETQARCCALPEWGFLLMWTCQAGRAGARTYRPLSRFAQIDLCIKIRAEAGICEKDLKTVCFDLFILN